MLRRPVKIAIYVAFAVWLFIGSIPSFLDMIDIHHLPSIQAVNDLSFASHLVAFLTGSLILWKIRRTIRDRNEFQSVAVTVAFSLLGYLLSYSAVIGSGTLIITLAAGHPVEHVYVVQDAGRNNSRGCRSAVVIRGLPFPSERICGVPEELKKTLLPGDSVVVSGYGTDWGLFPDGIRKAR